MASKELKEQGSSPVDLEKGGTEASTENDPYPEEEYPSIKKAALIMISAYLSMFIVALVSPASLTKPRLLLTSSTTLGPYNHRNSYSTHN